MNNNPTVILQARMSSTRLPGKMMKMVEGKPLISYVIERLKHCQNTGGVIVATSNHESDDELAKLCYESGIDLFRGSLNNVADRFFSILKKKKLASFIRINGDSPLIDSKIIDKAVTLYKKLDCDIVTNVFPRSYPKGQSVEVIKTKAFLSAFSDNLIDEDKEHVTTYFYRNSEKYRIKNFEMQPNSNHMQLSIDTKDDLSDFRKLIGKMKKSHFLYDLDDIIALRKSINI